MSQSARSDRRTDCNLKPHKPVYSAMNATQQKFDPECWTPTGSRVHMVGIGGCGMCGAAEVLLRRGAVVSGSDCHRSTASESLSCHGASISIGQRAENVPEQCDLVVHSAAVKESNPELGEARRRGLPVLKYSQLLGLLMAERTGLAIAGTHGKSTTTAMTSYVLRKASLDPSYVIGAVVDQLGGGSGVGDGEHFVVEACEYDRSYLNLRPKLAAILNIEEDHLDYYNDLADITESFADFTNLVPSDGVLVVNGEDRNVLRTVARAKTCVETFGFENKVDWRADVIETVNGCWRFRVLRHNKPLTEIQLSIPGRHNVANAMAAMALCFHAGVEPETIAKALSEFRGVDRRLSLRGVVDGVTVVDDYAHHPTEIQATLRSAREYFEPRNMYVVFQPHQHSRTRFFLNDFARSFGSADTVIVPDIYFVRDSNSECELIDSIDLVEKIHLNGGDARYEKNFARIVAQLCREVQPGDMVMTMGAGTVWQIADQLLDCLKRTRNGNGKKK